jgi:hypothetical protein
VFFTANWKWFAVNYPCETTQSIYMHEYAQQLLRKRITQAMFHAGIDRARDRVICKESLRDWPSPLEFVELCLPTADELGLPSFEAILALFSRFSAYKRSGSKLPFTFNSDFEEHIHFLCCARLKDTKEVDWIKLVRVTYDYWVGRYRMGDRPIIQKKLEVIPESVPRINRYIDQVGLPELGQDLLSQKIREFGLSVKSRARVA